MPGTATTILIDGTPTNGSDAWIDSLVGGGAWKDSDGGTVTIQWTAFQGTMDGQNSYSWTSLALTGLREALSLWEAVANIDFVEVSGAANADVKFWWGTQAQAGGPGVLGWSDLPGFEDYYENPASETRDILFNAQDSSVAGALGKGGLGLVTMVHEIGHLLGLAHPHDGGAGADATTFPGIDWWWPYAYGDYSLNQGIYTTMSYNFGWPSLLPGHTAEAWGLQYGPMALDIAAIQAIYGANTSYASGNNVYTLPTINGTGTYWSTIWDTGGVDTISNAGASGPATIDLRAATAGSGGGGFVSYGNNSSGVIIEGGFTIARGVVIENAIGGNGNDTLIGNAANNRLEGGTGWDTLDGGVGADTMVGGSGLDTFYVDDSGDVIVELVSFFETDTVYSLAANYTLSANVENLTLSGTASINAKGNSSGNLIIGNSGNNVLESGGGADSLYGGAGTDRLILTDTAFQLADGGTGTDTLALGGAGLVLDLSNPAIASRLQGIERVDLTGAGDNTLIISQAAVLGGVGMVAGDKHVLVVEGNSGDKMLFAESNWAKAGSFTNVDGTFDRWVLGSAEVHVEQAVSLQTTPLSAIVLLSSLNGSNGFKLSGGSTDEFSGSSVASAGDVNGDGFGDVIIGSPRADAGASDAGASYVVFGKASGFAANINLATLNGSDGFTLIGGAANDLIGYSVASAGDVNGDGFADLIVGGPDADPTGNNSGASYVVFGKASGFVANFNLSTLNGANGFRLNGAAAEDFSGQSVASAGDFNNDGFDDLIVGAWGADPHGSYSGAAYIVYGKAAGFAAAISLSALTASTGLRLAGVGADDQAGASVASAGDVNGDGYDDVIIGARNAYTSAHSAGASYVVFGRASGSPSSLDLSALNGTNGFRLSGVSKWDYSGSRVASAGDLNGDGFADLIVGAWGADPNGTYSGATYVVFGKASGFAANLNLSTLNGTNGFQLKGSAERDSSGCSVATAGDFNGDGFADLIVGAWGADTSGNQAGMSYVVFGKASGFAATIDLSALDGDSGFRIAGEDAGDSSGSSVASAGDVNGDGYDDLVIGARQADFSRAGATFSGASYVLFGGAFGASATPITIAGTAAAEILIGGRGNDVLTGGGGGDVFHAGAGDDRLIVKDLAFRLVDGGGGTDTLVLGGASLSLNLSNPLVAAKLTGIERIDLAGAANNNTLIVSQLAILGGVGAVLGGTHILVVERNYGDTVQFAEANWTTSGTVFYSARTFDRWVLGNAEVHVERVEPPPLPGVAIVGTSANDVISTTASVPGQPRATAFADTIDGGAGADTMAGGSGNDTYIVDNAGDQTIELVSAGTDAVNSSIDWTLGDNVENLTLTGSASINGKGNSSNNVITGNSGDNVLDGAGGDDRLYGGRGNDTYIIVRVDPLIASGRAIELAGEGIDTIRTDYLTMLPDNIENMELLAGTSSAMGNDLDNRLVGNDAANTLVGHLGVDTMIGGLGNDSYDVDNPLDVVIEEANAGRDDVLARISYVLPDNVENLYLIAGFETLDGTGNGLANLLVGNSGNNRLDGGAGADMLSGGRGDDTYVVDDAGDSVDEVDGYGNDTVYSSAGSYKLVSYVETLVLTGTGSINGTGNARFNTLIGNAGDNVLDGGGGNDTMAGGLGNDTYVVDSVGDVVTEGVDEGTDTVSAWLDWTLGATFENLRLMGTADLKGTGNGLNNALFGNAGKNILEGGGGSNFLDGGAGADTMTAGNGDDTYLVDNAGDVVVELADGGIDTVLSSIAWTLGANVENLTLTGSASIAGTGNSLANVLAGNAGNNVLDGGTGADTMAGGLGNDTYVVDVAGDVVTEGVGEGTDAVEAWVGWTLGGNLEQLKLMGLADLDGTGNGVDNKLFGNAGKNVLNGAAGADTMAGGFGDDTYVVDAAGDVVTEAANQGTDAVEAWLGWTLGANLEQLKLMGLADLSGTGNGFDNTLFGNAGKNVLNGAAGADTMSGGGGDDTYYVDNAGDLVVELVGGGMDGVVASMSWTLGANLERLTLAGTGKFDGTGNGLNNWLTGNVNKNTLDGGAGADTMAGGQGNDTYVVDAAGDVVIEAEGEGSDIVLAGISHTLANEVERLLLTGTAHLNGTGNGLANVLYGNDGNNVLDGKAAADSMTGGLGDDTYIVDDAGDVATEDAAAGVDVVQSSVSWRLGANFERLLLTGVADINATGNGLANMLTGNAGNNLLDGGADADAMAGGLGDDTYVVDSADDKVTEKAGEGFDTVRASIAHMLRGNVEKLVLTGDAAISGVGNAEANVIVGNAAANLLDGRTGADTMEGGAGDDVYMVENAGDVVIEAANGGTDEVQSSISYTLTANVERLKLVAAGNLDLTGNGLDNALTGNAGNNVLDGGLGADTMAGGAGDDTYIVDHAGDRTFENGGGGTDTVLSSVSHALRANVENLVLTGSAIIRGEGNAANNVLTGNDASNFLNGLAGADTMAGGGGDDTYMVDTAGDIVLELANGGTDEVRSWISYQVGANVERLQLYGTADIDGAGNELVNIVAGNSGHNILDGGLGSDLLLGGGGGDTFRFSTALGASNVDRIQVFNHAADTIQLDHSIFGGLGLGGLAAGAFNLGAVAAQADDRILFHTASKSLYYDADGLGGAAAVRFATLDNLTGTLDHTDFLIV